VPFHLSSSWQALGKGKGKEKEGGVRVDAHSDYICVRSGCWWGRGGWGGQGRRRGSSSSFMRGGGGRGKRLRYTRLAEVARDGREIQGGKREKGD